MKKIATLLIVVAVAICLLFGAFILGASSLAEYGAQFAALERPKSIADFGNSFSVLGTLFSSLALALGLLAVIFQVKQQSDANLIGALAARHQYLMAEGERLEAQIQSLKSSGNYNKQLFDNMVEKKRRLKTAADQIDTRLEKLFDA